MIDRKSGKPLVIDGNYVYLTPLMEKSSPLVWNNETVLFPRGVVMRCENKVVCPPWNNNDPLVLYNVFNRKLLPVLQDYPYYEA